MTFSIRSKNNDELRVEINDEHERRLNAGLAYDFGGGVGVKMIQTNEKARSAIEKVSNRAMQSLIEEIEPGNLRWDAPEVDFAWITEDNTSAPMDHYEMIRMSKAVGEFESRLRLCARKLKDLDTIPEDYADDKHWT